ncbi:MAG: HAMP domain-containing histidine kinase [Coriobacteriales bacterium]|jgi:signal transduction histidine kinase|nr:HAMP domain-containing histidine kinase [Coriobacteriales bacterium]
MKLWQKIFLLTLALVIVVVNATSLLLLSNNHHLAIERDRQDALSRHNYIVVELQNAIIYQQLVDRVISLDEGEALAVAREVLNRQRADSSLGVALFSDGQLLHAVNQTAKRQSDERTLLNEPAYTARITNTDDATYLLIVSTVQLNGRPYQLLSSLDITSTYHLFAANLDMVRFIGTLSALLVAGILLLLMRGLLGPLRDLSTTTRHIALGELGRRAAVKGHDEVSEVARNLNIMAESIERNVTQLEGLAESRRVFIGNLAHEMKTPLTSILGFADILRIKRGVSDAQRQEFASVIVSETRHLQGLSSKLMQLLTISNFRPSLQDIELEEYIAQLKLALTPLFERSGLRFATQVDSPRLVADPELLASLLNNLLDNAIKASPPGTTITLRATRDTASDGCVLTVTDQGAGIPPEQIPLLTEPFYMLDKARTRRHGGAGLGLALCAEIVRAHNATLQIESAVDAGASVSVSFLPTSAEEGHEQAEERFDDSDTTTSREDGPQPTGARAVTNVQASDIADRPRLPGIPPAVSSVTLGREESHV